MQARDIMTKDVKTISAQTTVREAAGIMAERGISGLPIVDDENRVIGMVTEGDLLHRAEIGTSKKRRSWWLELLKGSDAMAQDFVKAHAIRVQDIMSSPVQSVAEDASLADIAELLESHEIKRVPVVREGKVVGIVSRADLVRAFARTQPAEPRAVTDSSIRKNLLQTLKQEPWGGAPLINVIVSGGVVELYGFVDTKAKRKAIETAAENTAGVQSVRNHVQVGIIQGYS